MARHRRATPTLRPFYLYRYDDVNGVSGTGVVAVGVALPSGQAVMEWCSRWPTITVFGSVRHITRIHGHGGKTVLYWGWPPLPPAGQPEALAGRRRWLLRLLPSFGRRARPPQRPALAAVSRPAPAIARKNGPRPRR